MTEQKATFAGGCFWCMVKPFDEIEGVIDIVSGYTGGDLENPTYEQVGTNKTGHLEAVQITYNPELISYKELLDMYWPQIDPTDPGGQFHDRGESYQTAIFYHNDEQKKLEEESKKEIEDKNILKKKIINKIKEEKKKTNKTKKVNKKINKKLTKIINKNKKKNKKN